MALKGSLDVLRQASAVWPWRYIPGSTIPAVRLAAEGWEGLVHDWDGWKMILVLGHGAQVHCSMTVVSLLWRFICWGIRDRLHTNDHSRAPALWRRPVSGSLGLGHAAAGLCCSLRKGLGCQACAFRGKLTSWPDQAREVNTGSAALTVWEEPGGLVRSKPRESPSLKATGCLVWWECDLYVELEAPMMSA